MRRPPLAPSARAASTNSSGFTESVAVRTTRVLYGTRTTARANIWLSMPGPMTPTIAMASSTSGNAKKTSSARMITWSSAPPT